MVVDVNIKESIFVDENYLEYFVDKEVVEIKIVISVSDVFYILIVEERVDNYGGVLIVLEIIEKIEKILVIEK